MSIPYGFGSHAASAAVTMFGYKWAEHVSIPYGFGSHVWRRCGFQGCNCRRARVSIPYGFGSQRQCSGRYNLHPVTRVNSLWVWFTILMSALCGVAPAKGVSIPYGFGSQYCSSTVHYYISTFSARIKHFLASIQTNF